MGEKRGNVNKAFEEEDDESFGRENGNYLEFEDDFGDHLDNSAVGVDDINGGVTRSRPATANSIAQSLFNQASNDKDTELLQPPSPPPKGHRNPWKVCRFVVYLVVLLAVVIMCMISAMFSIQTLLASKNKPATTYLQESLNPGNPHAAVGVIFMAKGLKLRSCASFNFISLNIDQSYKEPRWCTPHQKFTLNYYDELSAEFEQSMHEVLKYVKQHETELTVALVKGPADWNNKQTILTHLTVPRDQAGAWGILHPNYEEFQAQFDASSFEGAMPNLKWELMQSLFDKGNSMNVISSGFRSMFLMNKNEFKNFGQLDAIRFEMEISLMEYNKTDLDIKVEQEGDNPEQLWHLEALYQWKDQTYMEGDSLYTVTVWAIVTVVSSALLMVERGYNTLQKAWNQAKPKPKKPKDEENNQPPAGTANPIAPQK